MREQCYGNTWSFLLIQRLKDKFYIVVKSNIINTLYVKAA